jgi:DNA-binding transcriptional LysR family regulator
MDLRRLRYFVVVAEEGNFTRAAARLHITQPPLSRQISELEREVGAALFVRSRRALRLTETGEVLLDVGRKLLAQADEALQVVHAVARGEAGRLRVGFVSGVAHDFLPIALNRYHMLAKDVAVELHDLGAAGQVDALVNESLHIGIMQGISSDSRIRTQLLRRQPICVVLPPDHPLANRPTVSVAELADENLILGPDGLAAPFARPYVDECLAIGVEVRVGQQVAERRSVPVLVASGLGVSIKVGPQPWLPSSALVTRPLVGRTPLVSETVAAWRDDDASRLVRGFVDALVWASAHTE